MRLYQFYSAAGTGSVNIQMLTKGAIVAVAWAIRLSTNINSTIQAELSMQSTQATATHNPVGIISICSAGINQDTAASNVPGTWNYCHTGLWCPVQVGDLIYLNIVQAGTGNVRALLHVQEGRS